MILHLYIEVPQQRADIYRFCTGNGLRFYNFQENNKMQYVSYGYIRAILLESKV